MTRPTDIDQEERAVGAAFRAALPPPPGTTAPDALEAAFLGSREIRARYMTSSMLWDLGLLYQISLPE